MVNRQHPMSWLCISLGKQKIAGRVIAVALSRSHGRDNPKYVIVPWWKKKEKWLHKVKQQVPTPSINSPDLVGTWRAEGLSQGWEQVYSHQGCRLCVYSTCCISVCALQPALKRSIWVSCSEGLQRRCKDKKRCACFCLYTHKTTATWGIVVQWEMENDGCSRVRSAL